MPGPWADSIARCRDVELNRHAVTVSHLFLNPLGQFANMMMSRIGFAQGVGDTNQGLLEVVVAKPYRSLQSGRVCACFAFEQTTPTH